MMRPAYLGAMTLTALLMSSPAWPQTPAPASSGSPAAHSANVETKAAQAETSPKREPSPRLAAARERQKACSAEWRQMKAEGKLEAGAKWPKFWSACNARLKKQGS